MYIRENVHAPVFWQTKFVYNKLFVGHPVVTTANLFWILTSALRGVFNNFPYHDITPPGGHHFWQIKFVLAILYRVT